MDYWHKAWQCPFFSWDKAKEVRCEGGCRVTFPDTDSAHDYVCAYCAGSWQRCSVAQSKLDFYDRMEDRKREQAREEKRQHHDPAGEDRGTAETAGPPAEDQR